MLLGNTSLRQESAPRLTPWSSCAKGASITFVKISAGSDLLDALQQMASGPSGWVTGVGDVEDAEVTVARPGNIQTLALSGRVTLASFSGPFGGPFMVTIARATDTGIEVVAGQLTRARAIGVMVWISDASAPASRVAEPRASQTQGPSGPTESPVTSSEPAAEAHGEDQESDVLPQYKDQVEHPVFGLCDVMVVRGDRMKIRDVHGPTRVREIHLGVLKVLPPVERDGVRVFKLVKR